MRSAEAVLSCWKENLFVRELGRVLRGVKFVAITIKSDRKESRGKHGPALNLRLALTGRQRVI